jgi:hypothetical protein
MPSVVCIIAQSAHGKYHSIMITLGALVSVETAVLEFNNEHAVDINRNLK